jgi:hypothetical protein
MKATLAIYDKRDLCLLAFEHREIPEEQLQDAIWCHMQVLEVAKREVDVAMFRHLTFVVVRDHLSREALIDAAHELVERKSDLIAWVR